MLFRRIPKKIAYGMKTDRGLCNNINQDNIIAAVADDIGLFVVSDGMGGHSRGELASQLITDACDCFWKNHFSGRDILDFDTTTRELCQVIIQANQQIWKQYNQGQVCGATVVVLLVYKDCYAVYWVGDSRVYTLRKRKLVQITVDDVWELQPFIVQNYTKEQIETHQSFGKLTQAVGPGTNVNVHMITDRLVKGQQFLLCSDGLYKYCSETDIKRGMTEAYGKNGIQKTLDYYIQKVYEQGAGDNVSIILVNTPR